MTQNKTIFISYSKKDVEWKDRLRRFLKPLDLWNEAKVWADDCIDAGADWYHAIKTAIEDSAVAVLLITTEFLGTEFIAKEEVPELLRLRRERGTWVIPVLIHPCSWQSVRWLRQLSIIPPKAVPLDSLPEKEQDAFLINLANKIAAFLENWQEPSEPVVAAPQISAAIDISHLPVTSAALFGRDAELDALDADWQSPDTRVVAFVAPGGVGKSALINRWLKDLEADAWRGADRVFGWSFYSQGARDHAATAEMFIDQALRFFADPEPEKGSPWDKGERLARLAAQHRTLLVLDGMEPLQSSQDFERGRLQDPGLQAMLRTLVKDSKGLCLISTREPIPDLADRPGFRSVDLSTITPQDARALLRSLRVVGTDAELEALAKKFGPHALSITLLGTWLYEQPAHAASQAAKIPPADTPLARILAAFETTLEEGPALEILRAQGLFDRPAPKAHLAAALDVDKLDPEAITRLRDLHLLAPHTRLNPDILEAHPLIREHYEERLRKDSPTLFTQSHRRIYDHLTETTEHRPEGLPALQPLYQAVRHGCLAGLQQKTCADVYFLRILRGNQFYSSRKLGAFGADLGAVACFFDDPWRTLSPNLSEPVQPWLLNEAAKCLRALGRPTDALQPIRGALQMAENQETWKEAAIGTGNLSELELTLGLVTEAVADAEQSVAFADRSGDAFQRVTNRTAHADALHQAGRPDEGSAIFADTEKIQAESQPDYPRLYSLGGFRYCDLLLAEAERIAATPQSQLAEADKHHIENTLRTVAERATQILEWAQPFGRLLDIALHHLTLARIELYRAILLDSPLAACEPPLDEAVKGLRAAGDMTYLPLGLLTLAWARFAAAKKGSGAFSDQLPECNTSLSACRDALDEAWQIAERGSMKLFMTDINLYRARFFKDKKALKAAAELIQKTGYHRRDQELAALQEAAKTWPTN